MFEHSPAGRDSDAKIWNTRTGRRELSLEHPLSVLSAKFSPDGTKLVTGSKDNDARVWDAKAGKLLVTLRHPATDHIWISDVAFGPRGSKIMTAATDHTIRMWDSASGRLLFELPKQADGVTCATLSADGTRIVTATRGGGAKVWDVR